MTDTITVLTLDVLRDTLQDAGYRVAEAKGPDGSPILTSATAGLGFEVRLSNPLPHEAEAMPTGAAGAISAARFADATFRAAFQVKGELPLALVNIWNLTHRFARLALADLPDAADAPSGWLVFDMDIVALGGVSPSNLRAQVEIWDRLVQELIAWLRAELPKLAKAAPVAEPAALDTPAGGTVTEPVPAA